MMMFYSNFHTSRIRSLVKTARISLQAMCFLDTMFSPADLKLKSYQYDKDFGLQSEYIVSKK